MKYHTPPYILPDYKEVLDPCHGTASYRERLIKKAMTYRNSVYLVTFREPPVPGDSRTQFFFSSITAIYVRFSPSVVGCCRQTLYNHEVRKGRAYTGKKCTIIREPIRNSPKVSG